MTLPRTPSFRLDGRRALVTGASSGIGLAAAVALAEAGAAVTLAARDADRLDTVRAELAAAGFAAETLALDVTKTAEVRGKLEALPAFDILVNSAGLSRNSQAIDATEADYDVVMDANLRGAFFVTTAIARRLIGEGKPGSLINVSSQMGHVGGIDRAVYCATKFGVEGFTKAMAIEWGPHRVRVNTIAPTFIRTPLAEKTLAIPERRKWVLDKIKLGRVGEVEDIMGAIIFLASDAAALITGTSLLIDGGWTAD
jgi:NAD(P)-dependent dehydrogenase (short-subunit alcohol dehydrogenase family)